MGCPSQVDLEANLTFTVTTHTTGGVATDADSVPTYRVYEDETGTAILNGSMAKLDDGNTTGFYAETIACTAANGFETTKTYSVYVEATVAGNKGAISYGFRVTSPLTAAGIRSAVGLAAADLDTQLAAIVADTGELQAELANGGRTDLLIDSIITTLGVAGAGLTAVPWNSAWDAEVQSECNDALVANNLDHLCLTPTVSADMTAEVADNTILSRILGNGDTSTFVPNTDGLHAAGVDLDAILADTNEIQTELANGGRTDLLIDSIITTLGAAGAGLTAIPWNASWDAEVQSECADALNAYDPPTKAEQDAAFTAIKGATWSGSTDTLEAIRDAIPSAAPTAAAIRQEIDANSTQLAAILEDTAEIGAAGAGLTAVPWNAAWDAEVQSECTDALDAYDPPTNTEFEARTLPSADYFVVGNYTAPLNAAGVRTALGMSTANLDTQLATIDDYLDSEISAIIAHLTDIKGTGFVKDTHSLPQCLTATGFSTLNAAGVRAAVGLAAANLDTQLGDIPTVAEFEARTLLAADYFGVANYTAPLSASGVRAAIGLASANLDTQLTAIVTDTNELQTDWANGGRLDLLLDATLADTSELQTDWADGGRLDTILDTAGSVVETTIQPTNITTETTLITTSAS